MCYLPIDLLVKMLGLEYAVCLRQFGSTQCYQEQPTIKFRLEIQFFCHSHDRGHEIRLENKLKSSEYCFFRCIMRASL